MNHRVSTDVCHIETTATASSTVIFDKSWGPKIRDMSARRLLIADEHLTMWIPKVENLIGSEATFSLPVAESTKNMDTVYRIYEWLGKQATTRDVLVVALGGGVLTDMVGYASATYLRGIPWAAIPTTLLGQADAAIGGKVGVNVPWGKNLVGAFHLPRVVAIDAEFLSTLPVREWRTGLGEVMKSALIQGGELFQRMGDLVLSEPQETARTWGWVIRDTAQIKISVVNEDLYENGPRMYLNLGHTIGHALENLLGYGTLNHGEAVAIGTMVALWLSEERFGLNPEIRHTVRRWMEAWGLPTRCPKVEFERLWRQLYQDKKARTRGLTWVLLEDVGRPRLVQDVTADEVQRALVELAGS